MLGVVSAGAITQTGEGQTVPDVTTAPVEDMAFGPFVQQRLGLRAEVRSTLQNKCRSFRHVRFRLQHWQISPDRRSENLSFWAGRAERAQDRVSLCYPAVARRQFERLPSWLVAAFDRIHTCEGSWTDPNPPYYGGLQMGWTFMRGFGPKALAWYGGPANLWPRYVQILVASRYYTLYGHFQAWPTCQREV